MRKGEIEGRTDPIYYCKELFGFLKTTKYSIRKLKDVTTSLKSGFGAGKQDQDQEAKGIIQIRPTNIGNEGNLKFDRNVYLPLNLLETQQENLLQNEDVLFNNTNSQDLVGKTAYFREEGNFLFSNHITRIRVKQNELLPKFLMLTLNTLHGKKIFYSICTNWNNQSGIGIDLLGSLKIPVPPLETQAQIVALFESAYTQKRAKEAQAKALLAGIDGYLLEALGIRLPPPTERKKFFYVRASQVSGERFDALFHQIEVFRFIKTGKFNLVKLKETVNYLKTGFAAGKQDQDLEETGVIQIRPTNIKEPKRDLNFDKNVYIKLEEAQKRNSDLLINNEVLFNNTNSQELVGKATLFALEGNYFCSNHITRIGVSEKIEPFYLTSILNLYQHLNIFYRICVNWNNQSGVNVEMLRNIPISLPPLPIQTEIATHITAIRAQAKQLEQEAKEIVEQAKQQVEKMILGE